MANFRGDRLRKAREGRYTQEELAQAVDSSTRMISRYETGDNDPTGEVIAKLAEILGISTDYLLSRTDDPVANLTEADLSVMERKLIAAVRQGAIVEAMETLTTLAKSHK
jgi:transcriptional regulator with XRE-family HTH domain